MSKVIILMIMLIGFTENLFPGALDKYSQACQKQDAQGCLNLGLVYAKGIETEQDYELAKDYLDIACDLGNTQACTELKDVDQLRNDSTETEEDNSLDKFVKDASRDCNRGDSSACLIIGLTCESLSEEKCNSAAAEEYYKKACDLGNILACSALGSLYEEGKIVERNYAKAKEYYQKACDLGDDSGYWSLGLLYEEGKGVERNYAKAKEYYQKACDLGDDSGCMSAEMIDAK